MTEKWVLNSSNNSGFDVFPVLTKTNFSGFPSSKWLSKKSLSFEITIQEPAFANCLIWSSSVLFLSGNSMV